MNVLKRSTARLSPLVLAAALLWGCQTSAPPSIKPAPPLVSNCLVAPTADIPDPPPPPVAVLTPEWAKAAWRWMSAAAGVITQDRTEWQGERTCIRGKVEQGAIR